MRLLMRFLMRWRCIGVGVVCRGSRWPGAYGNRPKGWVLGSPTLTCNAWREWGCLR